MKVLSAEFETLAMDESGWPSEPLAEIAIVGRSNSGKSSLINALCARRSLARVSQQPGRTRGLVFFKVELSGNRTLRLVDLPGYGFARISRTEREGFRKLAERFLEARQPLAGIVVLIDARRGVQEEDRLLCDWLESQGRAVCMVLTKIDEVPKTKRGHVVAHARQAVPRLEAPIVFSILEPQGRDELWRAICKLCFAS